MKKKVLIGCGLLAAALAAIWFLRLPPKGDHANLVKWAREQRADSIESVRLKAEYDWFALECQLSPEEIAQLVDILHTITLDQCVQDGEDRVLTGKQISGFGEDRVGFKVARGTSYRIPDGVVVHTTTEMKDYFGHLEGQGSLYILNQDLIDFINNTLYEKGELLDQR